MRTFTVGLSDDVYEEMEAARGDLARNAFVREAIEAHLHRWPGTESVAPASGMKVASNPTQGGSIPSGGAAYKTPRERLAETCAARGHLLDQFNSEKGVKHCLCGENSEESW